MKEQIKCYCGHTITCDCSREVEKQAEYFAHNQFNMHETNSYQELKRGFESGAEWQAERMYSEEDMTNYALYILHNNVITPKEWFNKVKKK
jgi:hypothetical protein